MWYEKTKQQPNQDTVNWGMYKSVVMYNLIYNYHLIHNSGNPVENVTIVPSLSSSM